MERRNSIDEHWESFETSLGIAMAAGTLAAVSIRHQEPIETTVATVTSIMASVNAISSLLVFSAKSSIKAAKEIIEEN